MSDEDRGKQGKNIDSESIANQKSMLLKYALNQTWEVVDIYSDDDYSGAGTYRPDFERMIKDCESGRINLVLCKTQSRFSRDMEVIEKYLHNKFPLWGVRFVSIIDNADTNNETNKKSRQINGLINEWYLEDLSNNVKRSLKNKREDGLYMGSFAPYGYLKSKEDKHKLIIDDKVAYIVREIFEKYKNGSSYHKICENLNSKNVLCPSLYKKSIGSHFVCYNFNYEKTGLWTSDTIAKMLKNEVYIGNLVQGKRTNISYKNHKSKQVPKDKWCRIENTHEPIIDKETWDLVQKRLGKHEKPLKNGNIHSLSQKVYCLECGKIFMRNQCTINHVIGKKEKRVYLECKGNKKYHICNNNYSIRLDILEHLIRDAINSLLKRSNEDLLKRELENILVKKNNHNAMIIKLNKEKVYFEQTLSDCELYFKNLYQDKIKNIISENDFQILHKEYVEESQKYRQHLKNIRSKLEKITINNQKSKNINKIIKKYLHFESLNKIIVDEFIDKIYVGNLNKKTNTREIRIEWSLNL